MDQIMFIQSYPNHIRVISKPAHFNYTEQLATPLWDDTQIAKRVTAENSYSGTGRGKWFELEKLQLLPLSGAISVHTLHAVALWHQANFTVQ